MNIISLFIIIILIVSSYLALYILKRKTIIQTPKLLDLSITLVGTFTGVFLALHISQWQSNQQDKVHLASLYDAAIKDLENVNIDVTFRLQMSESLAQLDPNSSADRTSYYGLNRPPKPVIPGKIIQYTDLHRFFSPTMKNNLFSLVRSIDNIGFPFAESSNKETNKLVLSMLAKEVQFQVNLFKIEKKYLAGKINEREVEVRFKELIGSRY